MQNENRNGKYLINEYRNVKKIIRVHKQIV